MNRKNRIEALKSTINTLHAQRFIPPLIAHIRQLPSEDLHRLLAEIQAHKPQTAKALT